MPEHRPTPGLPTLADGRKDPIARILPPVKRNRYAMVAWNESKFNTAWASAPFNTRIYLRLFLEVDNDWDPGAVALQYEGNLLGYIRRPYNHYLAIQVRRIEEDGQHAYIGGKITIMENRYAVYDDVGRLPWR